mmetsp:Transcript_18566/g.57659  ORF Transcript_18566/g.57659 Transcript_18566/m.57659 type:complete len:338 (+) Transcript_18566:735-1748(+)
MPGILVRTAKGVALARAAGHSLANLSGRGAGANAAIAERRADVRHLHVLALGAWVLVVADDHRQLRALVVAAHVHASGLPGLASVDKAPLRVIRRHSIQADRAAHALPCDGVVHRHAGGALAVRGPPELRCRPQRARVRARAVAVRHAHAAPVEERRRHARADCRSARRADALVLVACVAEVAPVVAQVRAVLPEEVTARAAAPRIGHFRRLLIARVIPARVLQRGERQAADGLPRGQRRARHELVDAHGAHLPVGASGPLRALVLHRHARNGIGARRAAQQGSRLAAHSGRRKRQSVRHPAVLIRDRDDGLVAPRPPCLVVVPRRKERARKRHHVH